MVQDVHVKSDPAVKVGRYDVLTEAQIAALPSTATISNRPLLSLGRKRYKTPKPRRMLSATLSRKANLSFQMIVVGSKAREKSTTA